MPGLIVPVVEGQSEVLSIGGLARRVLRERDIFDVEIARAFRVQRSKVVRPGEIKKAVVQAERSRAGATAILMLLDADEDCPAALGAELRAAGASETSLPLSVVLPKVESEAWILAGIESVRGFRGIPGDAVFDRDPETVRDAKGALSDLMEGSRGYVATADQPAFFGRVDLTLVAARSPSFDKFRRDLWALAGVPSA